MIRMHKLVPLVGGQLLSRGRRRVAGRHAGKLALATLAYEVWRSRQEKRGPAKARPAPRARWSGRKPR